MKLIAEIGWNHMGDMDLAKSMIDAAKRAGADYTKFQTWKVERLCDGPWDTDGRRQIYEKAELTEEKHKILREHCDRVGIKFLSSCFCEKDLDLIRKYTNEIKIPSPEAGNKILVSKAIEMFDEIYISTGAMELEEYAGWGANPKVTLLHCVSCYPCELSNINMPKMNYLKTICSKVGYSGHLTGIYDAIAAICNGAVVVEKHFTTNHDLPGRDNKFALLPEEFKEIDNFRKAMDEINIDRGLGIQECENNYRKFQKGRWNH